MIVGICIHHNDDTYVLLIVLSIALQSAPKEVDNFRVLVVQGTMIDTDVQP